MRRWHEEQELMQKRWTQLVKDDRRWRVNYPTIEYHNTAVERGGLGRMRKRRVFQGRSCPSCKAEKQKGLVKQRQKAWHYEQCAGGED